MLFLLSFEKHIGYLSRQALSPADTTTEAYMSSPRGRSLLLLQWLGIVTNNKVAASILQYFILKPSGDRNYEAQEPVAKRARRTNYRQTEDASFLTLYRTFVNHYGVTCVRDVVSNTISLLEGKREVTEENENQETATTSIPQSESPLVSALSAFIFILQDCAR